MIISLIVAASENNVIGKNEQLPWYLPEDLKYFKHTTWGMPVIMGRKTFESMGSRPLQARVNIVVTSQKDFKANGVVVAGSLEDALFVAKDTDCKEVFFIGGGEIFKEILPKAEKIYMTRIHAEVDGDIYFPKIEKSNWNLEPVHKVEADNKHAYDFSFQVWTRK